jgi:cysteine desulfurase
MSKLIYLDNAAATPIDPEVLQAMLPFFSDKFYNPSAAYLAAKDVKTALNKARQKIANTLGARPSEIIFTAGATEANNLAIQGVMRKFPDGEVLVCAIEHESVLAPASTFKSKKIPVDDKGMIKSSNLLELINDKTVLISIGYVNNELGAIQPLGEIADMLKKIRSKRLKKDNKYPLYLHTDAAQATNYLDIHVSRLGVNLMSLNGGKIFGPKQSGALYVQSGVTIEPLILGGGQEFNLRSGTENVAACVGFAEALEMAQTERHSQTVEKLRDCFEENLQKLVPRAVINGSRKNRAPHISSITIAGIDNERIMMELDENGVMCAVGSACSASSQEPSHVLSAIGLSKQQIYSTLRFSFGRQNDQKEAITAAQLLAKLSADNR